MKAALVRARSRYRLFRDFLRDWRRYQRFATPLVSELTDRSDPRHLETHLTKDYHRVEKGLTLPTPKRPFGSDLLVRLDKVGTLADRMEAQYPAREYAREATSALCAWNGGGDQDSTLAPVLGTAGGALDPETARRFFTTRRSVRHFDVAREVPRAVLDSAVELAATAPSVCNRQPWKVRFFEGAAASAKALAYQNGNRGFGESVPVTAVISVDLRLFGQAGERNQAWIDGGIFLMNFVSALHALGVTSCMLNLSLTSAKADRLRDGLGLAAHEVPIAMVAIGYPATGARVARSPRRLASDVATYVSG
ncbi:nitroreductase family protein [Agromyces silvae]|uniref:nitroreductase family protein n=1 Tax=Agromyces silvae TaxID=3388266 RepID=UPI00280A72EA|nr:nitroreductase family protein [Agromyces protaetiae]